MGKFQVEKVQHYINGGFVDGVAGKEFENISPFDNKPINKVAEGFKEDIDLAVAAARDAFDNGPWRTMPLKERLKYIVRIADLIEENAEEISYLESLDTGLPVSQTKKQAARAAENFRFYAEMVKSGLNGEAYQVDSEFINYTIHKPLGVVGLITPWNAPFMLETWKVAPTLATGNTCILKPAEWSPLTANKLAQIIDQAGLPKGVFNIVHGFGETAGASLTGHPDVQAISFTGETSTGAEIIKNGADTMKRFSMELGGKSPAVIFPDADLEKALDSIIWGIYSFNGERCTSNSRLFVHESIIDQFVDSLKERVLNITVGDPMDPNTEVGPLIHRKHYDNVRRYINIAKEEGAEVVSGNIPNEFKDGNYIAPTLLLGANIFKFFSCNSVYKPTINIMLYLFNLKFSHVHLSLSLSLLVYFGYISLL